jgi:aminocarboxymuconate-semialdehyde decarboxylase
MKIIDFHAHIVPSRYPERPRAISEPSWPSMEKIDERHSRMMIAGRQYRVFESFYWDVSQRIARLDEEGIAIQVISPLPELLSYWLAADAAEALTDFMNGLVAEMVAAAPQRFVGMGSVALQEPLRAVRQLESFGRLGLKGVHIGSHVNGTSIADARLHPFYEAAEALGLVVFVHGIRPASGGALLGPPLMPATLGVPHETAVAIGSLIMTDILGRFPGLKLVFSHGGGTFGALLDRFNTVWAGFDIMRAGAAMPPADYARRFFYDTVVYGPEMVRLLASKVGTGQLLAGTDGPVSLGQPPIAALLRDAGLTPAEQQAVACGNAERLLGP